MSGGVVRRSILIPAGPDEVWDALVDPSRLEDWFADEVDGGELARDEEVVFRWEDGSERTAVVEEVEGPRRLVFRWGEAGGAESRVSFELVEEAPGTRVTVVESELTGREAPGRPRGAASGGAAGGTPGGWAAGLGRLRLAASAVAA